MTITNKAQLVCGHVAAVSGDSPESGHVIYLVIDLVMNKLN